MADDPKRQTYEFTLVLPEGVELTSDLTNALFEAGCDDATPSMWGGRLFLAFTREAASFCEAVDSAARNVGRAVVARDGLYVSVHR